MGYLLELYNGFINLSKSNPIVASAMGLYGMGVITFIFKNIPNRIIEFFKTELTTNLVVNSQDDIFEKLLFYISDRNINNFLIRSFGLRNKGNRNEYYTATGESKLTTGFSRIYFIYDKHLLFMDRVLNTSGKGNPKETITLTVLGRNKKIFEKLHEEINKTEKEVKAVLKTTNIYRYNGDNWSKNQVIYKRALSTVIIDTEKKNLLVNHINKFLNMKEWYLERGIPWKTGIILYGPPGTGKTSIIKALAGHFNKNLAIIDEENLVGSVLNKALAGVTEEEIAVIEDIDSIKACKDRNVNDLEDQQQLIQISLSGILNAIDGVNSNDGRILIATTNHIEKLDSALVREGRFDLKIEIGFMTTQLFKEYILSFYPNLIIPDNFTIKPETTPAMVQGLLLRHMNNPLILLETFHDDTIYKYKEIIC